MSVSLQWLDATRRWQLQWKSSGKKTLYITAAALNGSKGAAEQVAVRLKADVESATNRQEVEGFWEIRDKYVAEAFEERSEAEEQVKKRKQRPSDVAQAVAAQRQRLAMRMLCSREEAA